MTIAAACLGAVAPPAHAGWLPAAPLSPAGEPTANGVNVVTDATGDALAVWSAGTPATTFTVMAVDRPAGDAWQAPVRLSLDSRPATTTPADPGRSAESPDVAVNATGDAVVVWRESNASNGRAARIRARYRPAGGAWGPTRDLSDVVIDEPSDTVANPSVAITPDGGAVAVWTYSDGGMFHLQTAALPAGATDWGTQADLTTGAAGQSDSLGSLVVTPAGEVLAAWRRSASGTGSLLTRLRSAAGAWGAVQQIPSGTTSLNTPNAAVDGDGNAVALWLESPGGNGVLRSSSRPAGGSWQTAKQVSAGGENVDPTFGLAAETGGDAVVVYTAGGVVRAARLPKDGAWQSDGARSAGDETASAPQVAVGPDGRALAAWVVARSGGWVLQAARRAAPPTRTWDEADDVAAGVWQYARPVLQPLAGGNAFVAWQTDPSGFLTADFDAAAPTLTNLVAAATGKPGTTLSFSVTAAGATRPVTWDFGDGQTATGEAVDHAFASAGTYTVTVRAADEFGPPTTATATVKITAPAADPGPGKDGGGGGGGSTTPPPTTSPPPGTTAPPPAPPVRLTLTAPAQRIGAVRKARAITATCRLTVAGRCAVTATVTPAVARALGLTVPRGAKRVTLARGSAGVAGGRTPATVRLRLSKAVVARLARRSSLPVTLTATATTADRRTATASRRFTVRR